MAVGCLMQPFQIFLGVFFVTPNIKWALSLFFDCLFFGCLLSFFTQKQILLAKVCQRRRRFDFGAKLAFLWSKQSTTFPFVVHTSTSQTGFVTHCKVSHLTLCALFVWTPPNLNIIFWMQSLRLIPSKTSPECCNTKRLSIKVPKKKREKRTNCCFFFFFWFFVFWKRQTLWTERFRGTRLSVVVGGSWSSSRHKIMSYFRHKIIYFRHKIMSYFRHKIMSYFRQLAVITPHAAFQIKYSVSFPPFFCFFFWFEQLDKQWKEKFDFVK